MWQGNHLAVAKQCSPRTAGILWQAVWGTGHGAVHLGWRCAATAAHATCCVINSPGQAKCTCTRTVCGGAATPARPPPIRRCMCAPCVPHCPALPWLLAGAVSYLDFHPWLPDVLLSAGSDGTCCLWAARDGATAPVVLRPGPTFGPLSDKTRGGGLSLDGTGRGGLIVISAVCSSDSLTHEHHTGAHRTQTLAGRW